jgi:hypothetical protein
MSGSGGVQAGAALVKAIREGLPAGVELDEREEALLDLAARQADDVAALEADIGKRGFWSKVRAVRRCSTPRSQRCDRVGLPWGSSSAGWIFLRARPRRSGARSGPPRPVGSERASGAAD